LQYERALLFANGDIHDGQMVQRALAHAADALIIAADGGARVAAHFGLRPHCVIGDMDSIDPALLAELAAAGVEVQRYPQAKDETDLELALLYAVAHGASWLRVIGAIGDRLDQTLSNVYLLALPQLRGCDARLVAGKEETSLLLPGTLSIEGAPGDTVSLLPVSGIARGVRTEALEYALEDEDLLLGPARGISNVMRAAHAAVHLREGALLVLHTIGRA
jgi:thiamine pyrophosphokinase